MHILLITEILKPPFIAQIWVLALSLGFLFVIILILRFFFKRSKSNSLNEGSE